MKKTSVICVLACSLLWSCSKEGKRTSALPRAPSTDALWALAPENTKLGVVAAGGTGELLLAAFAEIERSMASLPAGSQELEEAFAEARRELPPQVFDAGARKQMGIDLGRGAALFMVDEDEPVAVLPVVDREAFRKAVGGQSETQDGMSVDRIEEMVCSDVAGHYVCARSAAWLAKVGKSDAMARRVAARPASLRGHIEVAVSAEPLLQGAEALSQLLGAPRGLDAAMLIERGAFTVRAHLETTPAHPMIRAAVEVPDTLAKSVAKQKPAGMWRFRVPLAQLVPAEQAMGALAPLAAAGNIDVKRDVLDNLTGELVLYALPGDGLNLQLELGVRDGKRLQPLVAALCDLGKKNVPPIVPIDMKGDRCTASVDPSALGPLMGDVPFQGTISAAVYTTGSSMGASVSMASLGKTESQGMNKVGSDLMTGGWNLALWGYGSLVRALEPRLLDLLRAQEGASEAMAGLWIMAQLSELGMGIGVRNDGVHALFRVSTQWANPDAVVREYQGLVGKLVSGDASAMGQITALAEKSKDTELGRSYKAGVGGFMASVSSVGIVTAISIPAFVKYQRKARSTEARMNLRKLFDGARMHYMETSRFPGPSTAPTPATCCDQGDKCAPDASRWANPPWTALQFSLDDAHDYSYQYEVIDESREFVVRALGDLDCDGSFSTFEMRGVVEDGSVTSGELMVTDEIE